VLRQSTKLCDVRERGGYDFRSSIGEWGLTARERWLREHKEVKLYLKRDEYDLLESLASEEGLAVKDFMLKLARELKQPKAEISTLRKLDVNCGPARVVEYITELKVKLLLRNLEYAVCMEYVEWLKRRL
jgi:hypothetical protein